MVHILFLHHTKIFNLDDIKNEHNEEHNEDHLCRNFALENCLL